VRFANRLQAATARNNSLLCVGLDPDTRRFPKHLGSDPSAIVEFNRQIIEATIDLACCYKPNLGFYMAYGAAGLTALAETCAIIDHRVPVLLDAKVGDINTTSEAYARGYFEELDVDAVTVHPYMGLDSIEPFLKYEDRGAFILIKTSNPGSKDVQDLRLAGSEERPLYEHVAAQANAWNARYGNCGLVVGATWPGELSAIRATCPNLSILVPGVGTQGGDLEAAVQAGLDAQGAGILVNSSRGIIYAGSGEDFARASRRVALELRDRMNAVRTASDPA
jgi:orotidine-5'-phosphate decarboxylase